MAKVAADSSICRLQVSEGSTIIDLTSKSPRLVRDGKGDASPFMIEELALA